MSTTPANPARSDRTTGPDDAPKPKLDLSATQVLGGALAAMTAAFLGSRLSVAGTVIGAAMASIVAAVGSSVYTASLRTTQEKVRTAFRGRVAGADVPAAVETVSWEEPPAAAARPARVGRVSWRKVALAALAAFALAGVVLTGLELATGQALSGGKGTTISQVTEQQDPAPKTKPTAAPTSASPSPSEETRTASPTPTPEPSTSAPEPSAPATSATPAPAPSPSTSSTPSASSAPASPSPSPAG